jgi:hypothetical protein
VGLNSVLNFSAVVASAVAAKAMPARENMWARENGATNDVRINKPRARAARAAHAGPNAKFSVFPQKK